MILMYSVLAIEGADLSMLPASFKALEHDLALSPSLLATTLTAQMLAASLARPCWGFVVDSGRVSRRSILCVCCAGWGLTSIFLGVSVSFQIIICLRFLTGICVSAIHPLVQSIVADTVASERRGRAFGHVSLIEIIGGLLMASLCTSVSTDKFYGISGWRWIYVGIGIFSICWGLLVFAMMEEPPRPRDFVISSSQLDIASIIKTSCSRLWYHMANTASFRSITIQGCCGAIPFSALAFLNLWLQSLGTIDATTAGSVIAFGGLGSLLGVLIGGSIGDSLEHWKGLSGRSYAGTLSLGSGVIITYFLFNVVSASNPIHLGLILFLMHACINWCQCAVNRPVFSATVNSDQRASVMGWSLGLENIVSSLLGAPMVGFLVENFFGYNKDVEGPSNGVALAKALTIMCMLPWLVAALLYCFFLPGCIENDMLCKHEKESLNVKA